MKYLTFNILTLFGAGVLLVNAVVSCSENKETLKQETWSSEKSTEFNKQLSKEEQLDINLFLARKPHWNVQKTGTGLHYFIYEKGIGNYLPQINDKVEIEYKISLLDGTECYATLPDEVEEIRIDKVQIESGIQEAIKLLHTGDKAILIIPSHLAHGLVGDMSKIPPHSTLIVDLSVYKITPEKQ